ncbi:hypothetical protein [Paraburkholderia diazotrophica]|uniref:hypothetical protein n=1 Tax=Paraburkholderia diazotrophica TaxID=667676 RepID=UPI003174B449
MARDRQVNEHQFAGVKAAVLGFFLCFFLLISSGRIGSYDAGQQLSAATLAATQHALSTSNPPDPVFWSHAPNGRYYEPHDLGAELLMLPAAWIGAQLDHRPVDSQFLNPPLPAKVGVSLTYAVVCATGCFFLFLLFAQRYAVSQAFLIVFTFAAGTYYLAYAKVAWDVAPCAAAMCAFLYYAQRMLLPDASARTFAAAGFWLAVVCTFRYSMAPAFVVALVFLWWRTRASLRPYLLLASVFVLGMVPMFVYNAARTGSFWRPANTSAFELSHGNAMDGNIVHGFLGLIFSSNRGLFFYSPILLLGLLLPWIWRGLQARHRHLIEAMSIGTFLYMLVVSKLNHWGAFGWGPRYLLPCLPIMFLVVGPCLVEVVKKSRLAASVAITAAVLFNVAPATTNWHVIIAEYPGAEVMDASTPYALEGIWEGFWRGVNDKPLVFANSNAQFAKSDDGRRFPDFWTARLIERSSAGRVAGWLIIAALLGGMAVALRRIVRRASDGGSFDGLDGIQIQPERTNGLLS